MDTPPRRKITRLADWDYSRSGAYAVTICTHDRVCLFGDIVNGEMQLNVAGRIAAEEWRQIPVRYPFVILDEFVVMPDHMHGMLYLDTPYGLKEQAEDMASHVPTRKFICPPAGSLHTIVGNFKSGVTRRIRQSVGEPGLKVWQPRFIEHIIRDRRDLLNHQHYILKNPANWLTDDERLL